MHNWFHLDEVKAWPWIGFDGFQSWAWLTFIWTRIWLCLDPLILGLDVISLILVLDLTMVVLTTAWIHMHICKCLIRRTQMVPQSLRFQISLLINQQWNNKKIATINSGGRILNCDTSVSSVCFNIFQDILLWQCAAI